MSWYKVEEHKFECPDCECTETQIEIRILRTEERTRHSDGTYTSSFDEEVKDKSEESCASCGAAFDSERWEFGRCQACGGHGYDCEELDHCTRCKEVAEDCECERAECCENFPDECECKESDVKGKDAKIEKGLLFVTNVNYGSVEKRLIEKASPMFPMLRDPTGRILADIIFPSDLKEHTAPTPDAPPPDPVPDKNRVQTPAVSWRLPDDLPEE